MSVYEQIAVELARGAGYTAEKQYKLKGHLGTATRRKVSELHRELQLGNPPSKERELSELKKVVKKGEAKDHPHNIVDVYVKKPNGEEYYFDITTVKPNKKEFDTMKLKLLTWAALRLSQNKNAKINTAVVIPYNPYHPQPYSRWTVGSLYDKNQLIVGKIFWDFVSGGENYEDILSVFREVGKELKSRISSMGGK